MTKSNQPSVIDSGRQCCRTRKWNVAAVIWLLLVAAVIVGTIGDYGMSWDEPYRWGGGDAKLRYYSELFSGNRPEIPTDAYPGFYDLTLAVVRHVSGVDPMTAGHCLSALFGWFGLIAVWRIGCLIGGARAGFWALVLLTLMPRYYGHMFFNPKDIPFAACFAWGLWSVLRIKWNGSLRGSGWIAAGVLVGLTMSVRVGGLLLLAYAGAIAGIDFLRGVVQQPGGESGWMRGVAKRLAILAVVSVVAIMVLFLWWPAAHAGILGTTRKTIDVINSYPWNAPVMFDGAFHMAADLPFFYLPWYVVITLPEIALALGATGLVFFLVRLQDVSRRRFWTIREQQAAVAALAFAFPVLYVMARDVTVYDGMRHFLFILPPLAVLLGLALEQVLRLTERRLPGGTIAIQTAVALLLAPVVWNLITLHPYQYTYFNRIVGGIAGADGNYETDYWGTSYREAVARLAETVDPNTTWTISCFGAKWLAEPFLPDNFRYVEDLDDADFYLSMTRFNMHFFVDAPVIVDVKRQDVTLALVRDLRKGEERPLLSTGNEE